MVSASRVRNYLLNDPLLDWLYEYNISSIVCNRENRKSRSAGVPELRGPGPDGNGPER